MRAGFQMTKARVASPYQDKPILDPYSQPLYSAASLGAAIIPKDLNLFQYGIGGQVVGTGSITATEIHTNMEGQGGQLPQPKLFVGTGLRFVITEMLNTLTSIASAAGFNDFDSTGNVAAGGANADSAWSDTLKLFWGTSLLGILGERKFIRGPSWLAPGNTGLAGVAAAWATGTNATPVAGDAWTLHGMSKYWGFAPDMPLIIPPGQHFEVHILTPQATSPTLGHARLVYIVLDGKLGVESG